MRKLFPLFLIVTLLLPSSLPGLSVLNGGAGHGRPGDAGNGPCPGQTLAGSFLGRGAGAQGAEVLRSLSPELKAGIVALTSVDDDADGLTNTQEQWCTDLLNSDSDGDRGTKAEKYQSSGVMTDATVDFWVELW